MSPVQKRTKPPKRLKQLQGDLDSNAKNQNEVLRIEALRRYRILDTQSENIFDDITQLASEICQTPIALVSLVDSERQWFKSRVGLDLSELARDISFCGHAIRNESLFEIRDTLRDKRFASNPLVVGELGFRFYAGEPLISPNGHRIGTLCVIDRSPRSLTEVQKKSLNSLAKHVINLMEMRITNAGMSANNTYLSALLDNMSDGMVTYDASGKIIGYNQAVLKMLGLSKEQISDRELSKIRWKFVREDGSELALSEHPSSIAQSTGKIQSNVTMGLSEPDRATVWISVTAAPIFENSAEHPSYVISNFHDVTEKRAEQLKSLQFQKDLEENKRFLKNVLDTLPNLISYLDRDLKYTYVNSSFLKWFGLKMDAVLGKTLEEVVGAKAYAKVRRAVDQAQRGIKNELEIEVPHPQGQLMTLLIHYIPDKQDDGTVSGVISLVRNTTDAVAARKTIQDQQNLLEAVIQHVPSAITLKDVQDDLRILMWNKSAERVFGLDASKAIGKNFYDLEPPESAERLMQLDRAALAQRTQTDISEFVLSPQGRQNEICVRVRKLPILTTEQGSFRYLLTVVDDVSEDKRLKDALKKSETLFRSIFDNSPTGVVVMSAQQRYQMVNQTFQLMTGYSSNELQERTLFDLAFPSDAHELQREISQFNQNPNALHRFSCRLVRKDGVVRWFLVTLGHVSLHGEKELSIVSTAEDITELREKDAAFQTLTVDQQRAEEKLRQVSEVIDQSTIVSVTDPHGKITYTNDSFVKISGFSREELLGADHRISNSGTMDKSFFKEMWYTISAGKIWRGEICNQTKQKRIYWVDTTIVPSIDAFGKITHYTAIRYEITERKYMEAALRETYELRQAILDGAQYAIFSCDLNGIVRTFNKAAERMLGYTAKEVIGKTSPIIFHDSNEVELRAKSLSKDLSQIIKPTFEVLSTKPSKGFLDENEWTYVRKDGTRLPIKLSVNAMRNSAGAITGYLGISQDISESNRIRNELMAANDAALTAARSKSEFLANMSHEIRTPMNGVIGMCNLLLGDELSPVQTERLKIIQNCGNSLLNLINDVLDFSKLEAGKVELENEPFNLHDTTREIVELLSTRASEKGILFSYHPAPTVPTWMLGDSTRFRQIITNLVSNAIKFTERGSVTVISTIKSQSDNGYVILFAVKDTGVGIPADVKPKLFNSFSQADASTTRKFGGTGLGLAICKGLCERMGGTIWVESESGKGSTFFFTVKLRIAEEPSLSTAPDRMALFDPTLGVKYPVSILIVEDNRVNQLVVSGLLEKLGYRCDIAANGIEVLKILADRTYDLIFMDCHMPEMDGFETTTRIRQDQNLAQPRIVALTASMLPEDVDRCFACGMNDFVAKPVQMKELLRILSLFTNGVPVKASNSASSSSSSNSKDTPAAASAISCPLNQAKLLTNYKGLEDVLLDTIGQFGDQASDLMKRIKIAVEKQDASGLELAAHTLKGVVSIFYAEKTRAFASQLEEMGKNKTLADAGSVVKELEIELKNLSSALENLVTQI